MDKHHRLLVPKRLRHRCPLGQDWFLIARGQVHDLSMTKFIHPFSQYFLSHLLWGYRPWDVGRKKSLPNSWHHVLTGQRGDIQMLCDMLPGKCYKGTYSREKRQNLRAWFQRNLKVGAVIGLEWDRPGFKSWFPHLLGQLIEPLWLSVSLSITCE